MTCPNISVYTSGSARATFMAVVCFKNELLDLFLDVVWSNMVKHNETVSFFFFWPVTP